MGAVGRFFLLVFVALVAGYCSFMDGDDPRLADPNVPSESLVQGTIQSPVVFVVFLIALVGAIYYGYRIYADGQARKPSGRVGR